MKSLRALPLTVKLITILFVVVFINAVWMLIHAERSFEQFLFEQAKEQARLYLEGIEQDIIRLKQPWSRDQLDHILQDALRETREEKVVFSAEEIYLFDKTGVILAHSEPGSHTDKDMSGRYGDLWRTNKAAIIHNENYPSQQNQTDKKATTDIIIPVRNEAGEILAGMEAEINLTETMRLIKTLDDQYEEEFLFIQIMHAILIFLIFWWLIHYLLIRHIRSFDKTTYAIAQGNLASRIPGPFPADELGRLGLTINGMAKNIEDLLASQEQAYMQMLHSLIQALETKDAYTAGHSSRVAHYSLKLGQHIGLDSEKLKILRHGALMHDLGKIGVPDAILNKPSSLSADEFNAMKMHPLHTASIMRPLQRFKEYAQIAAWHHERWDGKGYPDGLHGENIPLLARIVAIADTWDAMTGDRVYRKGMSEEKALAILEKEQNLGQWDPELMHQFIMMLKIENQSLMPTN